MSRNVSLVLTRLMDISANCAGMRNRANSLPEIFPFSEGMRNSEVNRPSGTPQGDDITQAEEEDGELVEEGKCE